MARFRWKGRGGGARGALFGLAALVVGCADSGGGGGPVTRVNITLTDGGCDPGALEVSPGRTTFFISNPRSSSVQSFAVVTAEGRVVAQVANVLGGLSRSVEADLEEGSYAMRCRQGGAGGDGTLTVAVE